MSQFKKRIRASGCPDVTVSVDLFQEVNLAIGDGNPETTLWPDEARRLRKALKLAIATAEANALIS